MPLERNLTDSLSLRKKFAADQLHLASSLQIHNICEVGTLYYGDNLDILRRYVKDETIDLVYLDPPFNSNQDYNVLFAEQDGSRSTAQIKATSWSCVMLPAQALHVVSSVE